MFNKNTDKKFNKNPDKKFKKQPIEIKSDAIDEMQFERDKEKLKEKGIKKK